MNEILLNGIIALVSSSVCSMLTWILARKKYHTEVDHNLIQNMQESLEFYKKLSDDNKERLEEVLKRNDALEDEINEIRKTMLQWMNNLCYNLPCANRIVAKPLVDEIPALIPKHTNNGTTSR